MTTEEVTAGGPGHRTRASLPTETSIDGTKRIQDQPRKRTAPRDCTPLIPEIARYLSFRAFYSIDQTLPLTVGKQHLTRCLGFWNPDQIAGETQRTKACLTRCMKSMGYETRAKNSNCHAYELCDEYVGWGRVPLLRTGLEVPDDLIPWVVNHPFPLTPPRAPLTPPLKEWPYQVIE